MLEVLLIGGVVILWITFSIALRGVPQGREGSCVPPQSTLSCKDNSPEADNGTPTAGA